MTSRKNYRYAARPGGGRFGLSSLRGVSGALRFGRELLKDR